MFHVITTMNGQTHIKQISTFRGLVKIGPVKATFYVAPYMIFYPYFSH